MTNTISSRPPAPLLPASKPRAFKLTSHHKVARVAVGPARSQSRGKERHPAVCRALREAHLVGTIPLCESTVTLHDVDLGGGTEDLVETLGVVEGDGGVGREGVGCRCRAQGGEEDALHVCGK